LSPEWQGIHRAGSLCIVILAIQTWAEWIKNNGGPPTDNPLTTFERFVTQAHKHFQEARLQEIQD